MGLLDDLLGSEKKAYRNKKNKQAAQAAPTQPPVPRDVGLSTRFSPVRLTARKNNQVDLIVKIANDGKEKQLVSFEALAPKIHMIGFDSTVLNKVYEKKVGYLEPNASIEFSVTVYGSSQTKPGNYDIDVTAYVHFQDYNKVINYVKRKVTLRAV